MLVDDHPLFLEGISTMLSARGVQVVGIAHDGNEALPLARNLRPDVILMDVNMPRCNGVQATRNILAEMPEQKVVMLTVAADDESLFAALKSGASGYLLKNLNSETLFQMLTDLMRGEVVIAPGLASRVLHEFLHPPQTPEATSAPPEENQNPLTARQIEVLRLVAQGLTYKAIALQLHLSERTVKYHMGEILKRLQIKTRAEALTYAAEQGLTTA
jgi:two-component system NarL family response regulator